MGVEMAGTDEFANHHHAQNGAAHAHPADAEFARSGGAES